MGIGVWELLLLFMIVLLLFGTKRLRNIGGDLGSAIKSFRTAMNEDDKTPSTEETKPDSHKDDPSA